MKNLQQTPTREELEKIGFEKDCNGNFCINIGNMRIKIISQDIFILYQILVTGEDTFINAKKLTKQEINKAYELFGLEPPFKVVEMPKVGEVWEISSEYMDKLEEVYLKLIRIRKKL